MKVRTMCAALALTLCTGVFGANSSLGAPGTSPRMVSGDQGLQNLTRLMSEVPWYTSMDYVERKAKQEDKPIFWVHMLGPMNGVT